MIDIVKIALGVMIAQTFLLFVTTLMNFIATRHEERKIKSFSDEFLGRIEDEVDKAIKAESEKNY